MTGADPLFWPCNYCTAAAGEPCGTLRGRRAERFHADRLGMVRLWKRYGIRPRR